MTCEQEKIKCDATNVPGVEHKPYTAPRREIWGWATGRVAEFGLIGTFGQAMNIFTVGFGLSPVIVSWCMMLPRVVDGILDPIIGHWSDNTNTRWGRRKPFMIGGAFMGAVFLAALWWASPDWSPTAQFLYLGIIGMFLYLCYGAYGMSWNAIGYELSDDYHERSRVMAIGGFVLAIMVLQNSWLYWLALRPCFGNVIWGMRWIGAAMAVAVIISAVITVRMTKERFSHTNRQHVQLIPALKATLRNQPFVYLLLMKICEIFGGRLVGGVSFFLCIYYVCQGDQELATCIAGIGATLGTVWSFVVLPLVKPASQWIGKRGALILGAAIGFICAIINPFITTPEHPYWGMIPGLVVAPLLVISGTIAGAILPDICDVDELKSGERREGLFTSVMGFVSKLEISLAVVLVGYLVAWSNVDTNIGHRWDTAIDGRSSVATEFPVGENAVFEAKGGKVMTLDSFRIIGANLKEIKLFISDESPTTGFRSLGDFQVQSTDATFTFAPVNTRYLKIMLASAQNDASPIILKEIQTGRENVIAADQGGRLLAAQPPTQVQTRLFNTVMTMGIVFSFLTMVMAFLFPLTEKTMKEIRLKLDERHLARAVAGEPTDEVAEEYVHEHLQEAVEFIKEHPETEAGPQRKDREV